jgi:3-hydroxyisobutyrate dehydrogenase and related beta-hydroxyacid dehydrogenases
VRTSDPKLTLAARPSEIASSPSDPFDMPSVAFLGLGAIGRPMAARLAHAPGVTLTVWNRSADKARTFAREHGVRAAATPAEAADAEVVITCFPISADVESLLEGTDGLLAGMRQGTTLVDCTSGDPTTSKRIAARLAERGIGFLDAPVSGGTSGAEQGTLTVMVGGDAALLDRVRPALEPFAKKIVHCGPVGAGDALKSVNNALLAVHLWSAAEGLAALTKAGVAPAIALDVINASSGRSNASMNLFPERVLTRAFPRTFRLALLDKDVGIAAGVARDQQVPAPILQLTADLFRIAHNALGDEADHVEAVKVVEQWAGQEIA